MQGSGFRDVSKFSFRMWFGVLKISWEGLTLTALDPTCELADAKLIARSKLEKKQVTWRIMGREGYGEGNYTYIYLITSTKVLRTVLTKSHDPTSTM